MLARAMEVLKAEPVVRGREDAAPVTGCFAADLMSDVLAFAREGSLLVTGLATDQTIRTASIKHLAAVVVIEGKQADSEMAEAAREAGMPLYRTPLSKYEACGLLLQAGLRPYRKGLANPPCEASRDHGTADTREERP
jgi:predicted transcriptional regulator